VDLGSLFDRHADLPPPGGPLDPRVLPGGRGVCALTDENDRLLLFIAAENLRRTLAHRLSPPEEGAGRIRPDLRPVARRLWWTSSHSAFETSLTYLQIARLLAPDRYRRDLAFGPVWFARVCPTDRFPRWTADTQAFTPPTVDIGPFRDRGACRRFIELLEDLFDLCRHHEVLRQAPHGQPCAYKEMGRCPAPCDGSVSLETYRDTLRASLRFARGQSDDHLSLLEETMHRAARELRFEQAARLREQATRARRLLAADGRLHVSPEDFRYLVVQRGGGTTRVKPFFVDRGAITAGQAVPLREVSRAAAAWADKMNAARQPSADVDPVTRSEGVWLVSHFLLKGDKAPGLFVHASRITTPENLAALVAHGLGNPPQDRQR